MTIICWDGRYVAADTQVSYGAGVIATWSVCKLATSGRTIYALTGSGMMFQPMIGWHQRGAPPEDRPIAHDDDNASLLIAVNAGEGVARGFRLRTPHPETYGTPWGWGCELDFVLGCMKFGASPMEAVEAAIQHSCHIGGHVDFVDIRDAELEIRRWPGGNTA